MAENQERDIVTYCVKDGKLFPLQSSNYVYFMRRKPRKDYSNVRSITVLFGSFFLYLSAVVYSNSFEILLFPLVVMKCASRQVSLNLSEDCGVTIRGDYNVICDMRDQYEKGRKNQ